MVRSRERSAPCSRVSPLVCSLDLSPAILYMDAYKHTSTFLSGSVAEAEASACSVAEAEARKHINLLFR